MMNRSQATEALGDMLDAYHRLDGLGGARFAFGLDWIQLKIEMSWRTGSLANSTRSDGRLRRGSRTGWTTRYGLGSKISCTACRL